jgi:hypothetical protein
MDPKYHVLRTDSDHSGYYEFENISRSLYTVSIRRGSRWTSSPAPPINIPEGVTEYKHDIHLSSPSISGRIFEEGSGDPIPDVKVQAVCTIEGAYNVANARSNQDGYYKLENLLPGKYDISFWPENYAMNSVTAEIREESLTDYDIELTPVNPLWLLIKDQNGKVVRDRFDYSITGKSTNTNMRVGPCAPDNKGFYVIRNLGPGEYQMGITANGFEPFNTTIILPEEGYPKDQPFQSTLNKL